MTLRIVLLSTVAVSLIAGDAKVWNTKEEDPKVAASKDGAKIVQDSLGHFPGYSMSYTRRTGNGIAELHHKQNDIFVVESGEATLVTGGTVIAPKTSAPDEVRGTGIQGGKSQKLATGDVVHIPANTPHQLFLAPGKQITYVVVKTNSK